MRTDILDLHRFYATPLGRKAAAFIGARLTEVWGDGRGMRIGGFGFAGPFLDVFNGAERRLNFAPAAQGVSRWPSASANCAALVADNHWPLPDAALDRILIVHGLEETKDPHRLMREVWRVLAPDGRLIVVSAHRRGLWSALDMSPFAAGRPYSRRQLIGLLENATFSLMRSSGALYFPPLNSSILLRAARSWERAGARAWPGLSGVLLVEASKELIAPVGKVVSEGVRVQRRAGVRSPTASRDARPEARP